MARKKTHDEYVAEIAIKRPDVKVLGRYILSVHKILHLFPCGHEVDVMPFNVLGGSGCCICNYAHGHTKTHDKYVAEVAIKRPDIKVLGIYKGNSDLKR